MYRYTHKIRPIISLFNFKLCTLDYKQSCIINFRTFFPHFTLQKGYCGCCLSEESLVNANFKQQTPLILLPPFCLKPLVFFPFYPCNFLKYIRFYSPSWFIRFSNRVVFGDGIPPDLTTPPYIEAP